MFARFPASQWHQPGDKGAAVFGFGGGIPQGTQFPPTASILFAEEPRALHPRDNLFRRLFAGRPDVFPVRWENRKTGRSGYSPACANEWVKGICG
ncbi:TOTE conflict system archaeo-eukaryotic primase domain-containing protein, partial [Pseudodonghicola xiamenensis]